MRNVALTDLLRRIDAHLTQHPGDLPQVMATTTEAIHKYGEAVKRQQATRASAALLCAMAESKPKRLVTSIDAAIARWPLGYDRDCPSLCPAERLWWRAFLKVASKDRSSIDDGWLDTKRALPWWRAHVEPLLDNAPDVEVP